jgi:DNA-binding XRE family transcriptional regulator
MKGRAQRSDLGVLPPPAIFPGFCGKLLMEYDELISSSIPMHTNSKPIPNQLRKYRKARGLTQRTVARILGFADASSISRWEQGVCLPTMRNMFRLAAIYRTLVDALYIDVLRTIREEIRGQEAAVFSNDSASR